MPRYKATISLPGNVYQTECSGSYFANAVRNLARREGCEESDIYDVKEIRESRSSSSGGGGDSDGNFFWGGLGLGLVAFAAGVAFLGPLFTGPAAAYASYWGIKKVTGNDKGDYEEALTDYKRAPKSVLVCLALIVLSGGWGAVTGLQLQQDAVSDTTTEQVSQ
jgi:hypothetical protein